MTIPIEANTEHEHSHALATEGPEIPSAIPTCFRQDPKRRVADRDT